MFSVVLPFIWQIRTRYNKRAPESPEPSRFSLVFTFFIPEAKELRPHSALHSRMLYVLFPHPVNGDNFQFFRLEGGLPYPATRGGNDPSCGTLHRTCRAACWGTYPHPHSPCTVQARSTLQAGGILYVLRRSFLHRNLRPCCLYNLFQPISKAIVFELRSSFLTVPAF